MNIHWLQHVPFEALGNIKTWAEQREHTVRATRLYRRDPFPNQEDLDWLIVMGGPMNTYEEEEYPWLLREKGFIEDTIKAGKVVIGICLGAQLIANVLGVTVYAGEHKEIGWFPIFKTKEAGDSKIFGDFPSEIEVFHWHGDTFHLPSGCMRIAESAACQNQAFIYDERVVGLQFHLEITRPGAEALISNCGEEIVEAPYIQSIERILADDSRFTKVNERMVRLLDALSLVGVD